MEKGTKMSHEFLYEVDYIHIGPQNEPSQICDCDWESNFQSPVHIRNEVPVVVRREYYHQTPDIPHRQLDINALIIVRHGRGTRVVNGYSHSLARGDIFLMAQENVHTFEAPSHLYLDVYYFHQSVFTGSEWKALREFPILDSFLTPGVEAFEARGNTDYFGHLSSEPHSSVERNFDEVRRGFGGGNAALQFEVRNRLFHELVGLSIWRAGGHLSTRPARSAPIADVIRFCENNFQKDLKVEHLAAMMHVSVAHFREVFAREVGVPPASYLRRLRLLRAKTLLVDPRLSVAQIARDSGFDGTTQFGRAFKKAFGVGPMQYRKNPKAAP
ncbi:AraC family transcriptional regulator [bacterium]|nr:MAG: AraC family transcriptional regulator [bacterium]